MKKDWWDDQIRAYLRGKLAAVEKEQFEKMLREDPEFVAEVALLRAEVASTEVLIAADTRQLFQQWQTEKPPQTLYLSIKPLIWGLGISAVLLLLCIVFLVRDRPPVDSLPNMQLPPSPAAELPAPTAIPPLQAPQAQAPAKSPSKNYWAMARQHIQNPLSANLRRPSGDSTLSTFQQAQRAYAAGNYQQTLDLLAQTDSTRQQSATYLSAHALFQLRRFDLATAQFERLITQNSRQFRFHSEWGLLMCRLADRPRREAAFRRQLHDLLAQPQHPYFEQARALQKTLKE